MPTPFPMFRAGYSYLPSRTISSSIRRPLSLTAAVHATTTPPDLLSSMNATPDRVPLARPNKSVRPVRGRLSDTPLPPRNKSKPRSRPSPFDGTAIFKSSRSALPIVAPQLDKYFLHVHASSNNTLLHLMDAQGNSTPRGQVSAGMLKYRHKQRSTFDAGFQASLRMIRRIEEEASKKRILPAGFLEAEVDTDAAVEDGESSGEEGEERGPKYKPGMEIEVVFNGFGHGKQAFFAAMMSSEGNTVRPLVTRFTDRTHIKIGGERSPKARRL